MKRLLFIILLFGVCLTFNRAHAQRCLLGMRGIQLTGEGGYYLNFLSDRKKTFFAALGLSALAGYETVNWGESLLPDGSRLTDEDNFIYGGALTLELSAYVTDKIVLLVNGRQRVLFGGDCGKFHTQVGVGIRFMIR